MPLCAAAQQNWKAVMRYDKQAVKSALADRLQEYAQADSHAQLQAATVPSTKQQTAFAKELAKQLKHLGASQVKVNKNGIVTAEIPATIQQDLPVLALVTHLDTPPQAQAQKPQLHAKYTSGNIVLNKAQNLALTETNSPQLLRAHGHDFLTGNGVAPFGADSKAGLTVLFTLVDYLLENPSLQHGLIKLVILPDGISHAGAAALNLTELGADYAYTLGGTDLGEIAAANFSGKSFTVTFDGRRDIPLGQALSAPFADNLLMASDFHTLLPRNRRPETTFGTQGYITVDDIVTQQNRSTITGHIRAFNDTDLQQLTSQVKQAFDTVKSMYPKRTGAELTFQDQFKNAQSKTQQPLIRSLEKAMRQEDIRPKQISVRNQTDFAVLTSRGLPAVGVFTGVFHGGEPMEYADVDIMENALRTLLATILNFPPQPSQAK